MELMVAVAILLAILTMIGVVFNTAGRSSSQAQANSVAYRELRQALGHMRADLAKIQTGSDDQSAHAVLAIAGVTVQAYLNQKDVESNRPLGTADEHRADVLMLLTDRAAEPYVFRNPPVSNVQHVPLSDTVQVVYGHADLATLTQTGTGWTYIPTSVRRVEGSASPGASDMPAAQWHLARRVVSFPETTLTPAQQNQDGIYPKSGNPLTSSIWPTDVEFLTGQADVYPAVCYTPGALADPNTVLGNIGQGYYSYPAAGSPSDYGFWRWPGLNWYRFENGSWYLFDQGFWLSGTSGSWTGGPPGAPVTSGRPSPLNYAPPVARPPDVRALFYPDATDRRTILDLHPPVDAAERLSGYFLSGCSDFKVEYTYDSPYQVQLRDDGTDWIPQPQAPVRWQAVPAGRQMVWSRLSVDPNNYPSSADPRNYTDPMRWPRALRITIRTFGPGAGLERPIEETIVHTFD